VAIKIHKSPLRPPSLHFPERFWRPLLTTNGNDCLIAAKGKSKRNRWEYIAYMYKVRVCEAITPNKSFNAFAISESQRETAICKGKETAGGASKRGSEFRRSCELFMGLCGYREVDLGPGPQDLGSRTQLICHQPHSLVAKEITSDLRLRQNGRRKLVELNGFGHGYPGGLMDERMDG